MRHTAIVRALSLVGVLSLCGSAALADNLVYTIGIASTPLPVDEFLAVPKFDPAADPCAPRVLQSIQLDMTVDFAGQMQFENTDLLKSTNFLLTLTWKTDLKRPDPNAADPVLINLTQFRSRSGTVEMYDSVTDWAGESGVAYSVSFAGVTGSKSLATPADLNAFTGLGSVSLPLSGSFTYAMSAAQSSTYTGQATNVKATGGTLRVTYTYEVVPEPASLLMIVALSGLLCVRRR